MHFRIPFSSRAHFYTEEEIALVSEVMREADVLTQGKYQDEFEQKLAEYLGVRYAFVVSNATAGLELSAQLCCFSPQDEVIIPAHTFTSSAYPFIKHGAKPVWADIDLKTRVVTAETLAEKITPRSKAIVVVHLYGYMADMPAIMSLAQQHGLLVIEDCAQSLGAEMAAGKAGSFGDFSVFSFHSHKNITTLGEGGMLVVKDEARAKLVPLVRHNGHCGFDFPRDDYWLPAMGNVVLPHLDGVPVLPSNCCLGEAQCALGSKLLERLDEMSRFKRQRAIQVIDALEDCSELEFHRVDSSRHNYHLLVASLKSGDRNEFIRKMALDQGVQCVVQYYPLYRYDFYRSLGLSQAQCPRTDQFFDSMISFPFHASLNNAEIDYLINAVREVYQNLFQVKNV